MKFGLKIHTGKKHLALVGESGSSNHLHSLRDWSVGLGFAVLVFIGGVTYIGYDFYAQFIIEAKEVSAESLIHYHPEKVRMQAEEYNKREQKFNELRGGRKAEVVVVEERAGDVSSETGETVPTEAFLDGGVAGVPIAE
jgi:hypothetical protein